MGIFVCVCMCVYECMCMKFLTKIKTVIIFYNQFFPFNFIG